MEEGVQKSSIWRTGPKMFNALKKPFLVWVLTVLVLSTGTAWLFWTRDLEKQARMITEQRLQISLWKQERLDEALTDTIREKLELESRLSKSETQVETLERGLASLKEELGLIRTDYADLKAQLQQARIANLTLEQRLEKMKRRSRRPIRLGKVVVTPKEDIEGKILVVNKEYDFVVLNLGKEDGVDIGMTLDIYDQEQLLGKAQIAKVENNLSVGDILPRAKKDRIEEGNLVKLLK